MVTVNTVSYTHLNKMYTEIKNSDINASVNLFHSNFTKNDRKTKENAILAASEKTNEKMCIRDRRQTVPDGRRIGQHLPAVFQRLLPVSYTHLMGQNLLSKIQIMLLYPLISLVARLKFKFGYPEV